MQDVFFGSASLASSQNNESSHTFSRRKSALAHYGLHSSQSQPLDTWRPEVAWQGSASSEGGGGPHGGGGRRGDQHRRPGGERRGAAPHQEALRPLRCCALQRLLPQRLTWGGTEKPELPVCFCSFSTAFTASGKRFSCPDRPRYRKLTSILPFRGVECSIAATVAVLSISIC